MLSPCSTFRKHRWDAEPKIKARRAYESHRRAKSLASSCFRNLQAIVSAGQGPTTASRGPERKRLRFDAADFKPNRDAWFLSQDVLRREKNETGTPTAGSPSCDPGGEGDLEGSYPATAPWRPIGQWQFSVSVTAAFWNTRGGSPTPNVSPSDTTTLSKPAPRLALPLPSRAWLAGRIRVLGRLLFAFRVGFNHRR